MFSVILMRQAVTSVSAMNGVYLKVNFCKLNVRKMKLKCLIVFLIVF